VTQAWIEAARCLLSISDHRAMHMMVHIAQPTQEDPGTRRAVDLLMDDQRYQGVETIANTIFPEAMAQSSRDYSHLAERYAAIYPELRKRWHRNKAGTYFGRITAYPTAHGTVDQLAAVIDHLKIEDTTPNPKTARFETTFAIPGHDGLADDVGGLEDVNGKAVAIFEPGHDRNNAMAFPCLSHCSFQLGRDRRVHALAHYRSQYLLQRGYGNYLGLGRLLDYVATAAGLETGELTVVAGYVQLEAGITAVRRLVAIS
jgi:thymidylate synthase